MRPTTYRKKAKPAPPIAMAKVQAAVSRLEHPARVPQPRVSHAGMIPEDASRRGTFSRLPLRQCCNIHASDFA